MTWNKKGQGPSSHPFDRLKFLASPHYALILSFNRGIHILPLKPLGTFHSQTLALRLAALLSTLSPSIAGQLAGGKGRCREPRQKKSRRNDKRHDDLTHVLPPTYRVDLGA
jgi:hypothetical protein